MRKYSIDSAESILLPPVPSRRVDWLPFAVLHGLALLETSDPEAPTQSFGIRWPVTDSFHRIPFDSLFNSFQLFRILLP